ncbi:hypothetical protein JDV02_004330 [Purpureocillium takamizusanense]|uniref:Uncharacterized protein n=1 Tax=Purpureocillium takamizusanense TaxID=2060973 RepID=A0A9Q8V9U1_9HYPO|nr:uncharacterized protein JDV02_004330 [Purpureocillium takamizusanense]UNI18033.1 hypothetical protein JDV02_004330 [Purpureocillium takamizusanense]
MPLEQTITIVNNSGKIISTGKQLLSIFKEAKGAYQDKKAQLRNERSSIKRSHTFDPTRSVYRGHDEREYYEDEDGHHAYDDYNHKYDDPRDYEHSHGDTVDYYGRRRSHDVQSVASSRRSHRSSHSRRSSSSRHHDHHHGHHHHHHRSRPALTESNLKTLSEVSSTAPSKAPPPMAYRSPYAETMPLDMAMSKMDLNHAEVRNRIAAAERRERESMMVPRRRSEPEMTMAPSHDRNSSKDIDMHLAYGNIPPDLATRVDLDPAHHDEWNAHQLVHKVEGLLDEAHCLQHSATAIIKHLQEKPDAAAAVALTLAELSSAVAKMSPAFLGFLKGGSPAVFALLASPQFLIGTGIAAGLTVVMFGGWKIVKKVKEAQAAREAIAYEGVPLDRPAPMRTQSEFSAGMDEALVVDEELSTIETWRRGIMPYGADDESADVELITPEADRAHREKYAKDDLDFDLRSRRSTRTHKTSRTHRTSSHRDDKGMDSRSKGKGKEKEPAVPERKSSKAESVTGRSERSSSRKFSSSAKPKERKAIEDGRSRRGDDDAADLDAVFRPKIRQDNMLKAIFKKKEKDVGSRSELVFA